jgi:hypothetical protein
MGEGAIVLHGPIPMCSKLIRSFRGKSGGEGWDVDDNSNRQVYELMSLRSGSHQHLEFGT